ncbi:MAG: hypothetical protein DI549_21185 [Ancylobacter novellus]|uniref:Uncharacterized protein n=1 Tax=Ancylobacter novellus TaxID=921 RepID=A0A2W5QPV8_ANCNO|nr:MAG: hypothetical protein DI549_21185 [Ancylobacter novellus]
MESLWPQLLRYAISWAGLWMAKNGYATASDVELIAGALLTIAPPAWRIATTRYVRWRASRSAKA